VTPTRAQDFDLNNTHAFSPNTVNEARLNYTRLAGVWEKPLGGLGSITSFGFTKGGQGIIPDYPKFEGLPEISLQNYGDSIGLPQGTTGQYNNTFQIMDNLSMVKGKHTVKLGGDGRYIELNERNTYAENGWFNFNGAETGNDFADYLLGAVPPSGFVQSSQQFLDSRSKYTALYVEDSYKLKPNLTVNYGLRWEVSQPFYDTQGKIMSFKPGEQSKVFPDAPTGYVFPGDPGIPKTLAPTQYDNFAPRVGIAYSPGFSDGGLGKVFGGPGKTSIRAAFGTYYTAIEDLTLFYEVGDPPFGLFFDDPDTSFMSQPYLNRTSGTNPGQRFPFTIPTPGSPVNFAQFQPLVGAPEFKTDNVRPYANNYNLSIQRQLSSSMLFTIAYVGNEGHHLISQTSFNQGSPAKCLQIRAALGPALGCGPYGEDQIYTLPSGQIDYGTRTYSVTSGRYLSQGLLDFGDNPYEETLANSNYNGLQVTVEKRIGAVRLLGAYTWSKSIDDGSSFTDGITPYTSARAGRSLSTFDMAHNFVVSYSYDLPFEHLTAHSNSFAKKLLDGWQISGITRFTTGLPVTISTTGDFDLCGCSYGFVTGAEEPNYDDSGIHIEKPRQSASHTYFVENYDASGNPMSPFFPETGRDPNNPVYGVFGNSSRRFFHGPGLNNWDMALHKGTNISERVSMEFRAEFFNIMNHAQFNSPVGNFTYSDFGQVTSAGNPRIGQVALKLHF
jgi:hypothetical protein